MRAGLVYSFAAYFLWALFPLYFKLVARSGPLEIIGYRVVCSLLFCLLLIAVTRQWGQLRELARNRRTLLVLAAAGALVVINWTVYVYGVDTGRTLDAALGYFINPLVAAALGVVVLGERLSRLQWVAFAVGAVACVVLAIAYGQFPWIAVVLAATFGWYGLLKKRVGAKVPAVAGLVVETAAITPLLLGYLIWLSAAGASTVSPTTGYGWIVYAAGPITAIPLLLFAAGARRVQLVTLGMVQYVAPIGQFLVGWLVFREPMPAGRWLGFALVWVAVALFAASAVAQFRRSRLRGVPAEATSLG